MALSELKKIPLEELLIATKDGDWGEDAQTDGCLPYFVIRGGDFPDVRLGNIVDVPLRYLKETTVSRRTLEPLDILIETAGGTKDRPTGRTLLITESLLKSFSKPVTCASFARFLRIDPRKADPRYVFWYLQYLYQTGEMRLHQVQHTGIARFQYTRFAATPLIALPSTDNQKAIADILCFLDAKIELNRKMGETLEAAARAVFRSWFVNFEPVSNKNGGEDCKLPKDLAAFFPGQFNESPLGPIPKGWRTQEIGQLVDTISDTYPLSLVSEVVFLNTSDILNGRFLHETKSPVETLPGQAKKSIRRGDILYSEIRPENKRFAFVHFDSPNHVVSTKLMVLRARPGIDPLFLYFVLTAQDTIDFLQMMAESRSGTFPQITFGVLSKIEIVVPPPTLLSYFVQKILSPIFDRKLALDKESDILTAMRDTLLPKLIEGKISTGSVKQVMAGSAV